MADPDNTRTWPNVTRRSVLAGTAIAIAGWQPKTRSRRRPKDGELAEPATILWREWQRAHSLTERLCRRQQWLERKLIETVGFPGAIAQIRSSETATSDLFEASHELPNPRSQNTATLAQTKAERTAHQARWDAADKEIGYSATLRAERNAGERAQDLLKALSETPATSLAGVLAKLDAALREGQTSEDSGDPPWPLIRSAFEDVVRISQPAK